MVQVKNFKIRPSLVSDATYLYNWLMDKSIIQWFPMCNKLEVDDAVNISMSYIQYNAAITAISDNIPCGFANLYLHFNEKLKHQALFVIIVDPLFRGKGVGTEIIKELFKMAKNQFNIELLHLEVYEGNPAKKLYERLGFVEYGVHKKFLKDLDGKYYDKILMQKLL